LSCITTALVDKLTHEMAVLKQLKFAAKFEAYSAEQKSLIEENGCRPGCPRGRDRNPPDQQARA
jgi:hypothetical protein